MPLDLKRRLPAPLFQAIHDHTVLGCVEGENGWSKAKRQEDALTSFLGSKLATNWSKPMRSDNGSWQWRFDYQHTGGSGDSVEGTLGSDGIFQIELHDKSTGKRWYKGFLFQAKKFGNSDWDKLLKQTRDMRRLVHDNSFVFVYKPDGYQVVRSQYVIAQNGRLFDVLPDKFMSIQTFLSHFLRCTEGLVGLHYEASEETGGPDTLVVPRRTRGAITYPKKLKHKLAIRVEKASA